MNEKEMFQVYMAEDNREDQQLFKMAIDKIDTSIELKLFSNGYFLLKFLEGQTRYPKVIFMDLYMSRMNGEETLTAIRANPTYNDIPIVLFSSFYDIDYISNLFALGANRYLHKPSSIDTLVSALKRAFDSIKRNELGGSAIINYTE